MKNYILKSKLLNYKTYNIDNTVVILIDLIDNQNRINGIIIGEQDALKVAESFNKEKIYNIRGNKITLNENQDELNELFELGILDNNMRKEELLIINSIFEDKWL